jgi:hypothetical protein
MSHDDLRDTLPPSYDGDDPADLLTSVAIRLEAVARDLTLGAANIANLAGEMRVIARRLCEIETRVTRHELRIAELEDWRANL